jgi:hypothetical protein
MSIMHVGAYIRSVLVCLVADITLKIAAGMVDVRAQRATRPSIRSPIARRNVAEQVQIGASAEQICVQQFAHSIALPRSTKNAAARQQTLRWPHRVWCGKRDG